MMAFFMTSSDLWSLLLTRATAPIGSRCRADFVIWLTHGRAPSPAAAPDGVGDRTDPVVPAVLTVDGDLINRCEIFDEADIDAALARFDELSRPAS
jgi:hypothetical protein